MNGAGLIAFTITAALYGIISGQVLAYLRRNCRDRLALKVMVVVIWGLESAHVVFTSISTWRWAIVHHANPISAYLISWDVPAAQATMNFSIAMVQYIWIMRIWKLNLSRYRSVMAICMLALLAIDTVLAAAWAGLVFFAKGKPLHHLRALVWVAPATLSIQILNDVLATSMLFLALHRTGIHRGNALITKVLVYSLNTGFLTCISAIAILVAVRSRILAFHLPALTAST
ncbi:hypothetical protein FIBSPDRAFT_251298 [Athelia psychrophila]|uniref:Uncharacterized protein n=1 Tax=Athelia psychrophila TaxID=1759441 RepID=A0A165XVT1_9AGAM|nr:hypothetical protein FIBSPDRAFT_251298 [Fibularhizoctonia sp. CBS 109695]